MTREEAVELLKMRRDCANSYCENEQCDKCGLAITDRDDVVQAYDLALLALTEKLCPIMKEPCSRNCAWYDKVWERCHVLSTGC